MKLWLCAILVAGTQLAIAAPAKTDLTATFTNRGGDSADALKLVLDSHGTNAVAETWGESDRDLLDLSELVDPTIATSVDGTAVWVATTVKRAGQCAGLTGTFKKCEKFAETPVNALLLLDKAGKAWNPVVVSSAIAISDKDQAKAIAGGAKLAPLTKAIAAGAEDAAKTFETSFAYPKLLAANVSDRRDAVLFGSAPGEKWTGGKKVGATLASWKLDFTVHDGVVAGLTTSKTIAWVAANVDALPVGKVDAKTTPYRVLAIYEQQKGSKEWRLVAAAFSFIAP